MAFVFVVIVWAVLSTYIGRIEIEADRVIAEIVVVSPEDISALEAPVEIRFSARNVATALQQQGAVIQAMNWDLDGDGSFETAVSADPEVTHLYNKRETVEVGLQVRIQDQDDQVFTKIIQIQDAAFDATPDTGTAPLEVQFDASSILDEDRVKSFDWDFDGDALFDLEGPEHVSPTYTFEQIGIYTVQLRAIDLNNNVQNFYRDIEVVTSDTPLVSALIDASPSETGTAPFQVRFDADRSVSQKGTITKYEWDFGDGSQLQSGKSVSHIFDEADVYTVTLTVTDSLGNEGQETIEIEATALSSVQPLKRKR